MAIIVLMGAGASYGSVSVSPHVPPLGNRLFTDLVKIGGVASEIPEYIRELFEKNFEDGMAEYYKHFNGDIMKFQRELAYYLASFRPEDNNTYIKLITELGSERIIYSSLNYDLLFELSAEKLGLFTNYTSEYKKGGIRLLKIHGSSNFWPDFPMGTFKNCTFSGSVKADMQVPIRPLDQRQTLERCVNEDSLAPAIAMFAVGKAVKISPEYVDRQYDMWKMKVSKSSKIFIVGVRVHEVDEHIWGVLGRVKGNVFYFGFESDRKEFDRWKENTKKTNAYFHIGDFEKSVKIIKKRLKN